MDEPKCPAAKRLLERIQQAANDNYTYDKERADFVAGEIKKSLDRMHVNMQKVGSEEGGAMSLVYKYRPRRR